jgi:hypothetical protein
MTKTDGLNVVSLQQRPVAVFIELSILKNAALAISHQQGAEA